jgi:hypothetical protein
VRNIAAAHNVLAQEFYDFDRDFYTKFRDISRPDGYPQKRLARLEAQRAKFGEETPVTRQDEELPRPVVNDWA